LTASDTLDFDLITVLAARAGRLEGPDRKLGLQILAATEPTTDTGLRVRHLLEQQNLVDGDVPPALDITGSTDAAFDFYERHLDHAEWSMFRMETRFPSRGQALKRRAEGPYHIQIETPGVLYCGDGWTRPTCIVNGVLRALLPLHPEAETASRGAEIDEALLRGIEGLSPTNKG